MKTSKAAGILLALSLGGLQAQYAAPEKKEPTPVQTKSTDAVTAEKAKPDVKELMEKSNVFTNSIGMELVKVSATLWVGKYEVTQKEYQEVTGRNPSQFTGDRNPVDSASWDDAREFCRKLTENERKEEMLPEGFIYTLPTQAQWESLAASASLKDAVTSEKSSRNSPAPVGSLGPAGPGVHDIRGNVWEWCLDPEDKPFRVLRGGAWDTSLEINLRPEFRYYSRPDDRQNNFGFRCALVSSPGK